MHNAHLNVEDLNVCVQGCREVKWLVASVDDAEVCSELLLMEGHGVDSFECVRPEEQNMLIRSYISG